VVEHRNNTKIEEVINMSQGTHDEGELHIVTEVGVFGELDLKDPTKKKVQRSSEIEELIREASEENVRNLAGK
jgi:hypothetical protein